MAVDAIRDVTLRGELVLDPFAGVSTTLLACERTGRIARCIERDPSNVDAGIIRWERATGKQAIHLASGLSFASLASSRTRDAMEAVVERGSADGSECPHGGADARK